MSTEALQEETLSQSSAPEWEPPMPPTDLIFDDGEPLESNRHRIGMNALIRSMLTVMDGRTDYFVGGNMFIYFSSQQARNRDFRGPDFFVVLNVEGTKDRQGWVVWEEEGRYPDVIIELMSSSTAAVDTGLKKTIYEQTFRTPDYFVFDPFEPNSLRGWHLNDTQRYQELTANERGWLWCQRLGLWLGTWEGEIEGKTAPWLRFYDQEGNLILLPEEAERQRAETERQRAETERQRAETERQRAQEAEQKLETAQQQGIKEGAVRQLLRLLRGRFGEINLDLESRLQQLEVNQLENLIDVGLTAVSLEEFFSQLPGDN